MVVARLALGYLSEVGRVALLLALCACKTGSAPAPSSAGDEITYHGPGNLAEDDAFKPTYDKSDLKTALTTERAAYATTEQRTKELADSGDYDQLRVAQADLAVRARFITSLEVCESTGRVCPPRLDEPAWSYDPAGETDPKLDAHLRFDVASWQKVADELYGRACACRTIACIDSMFVAIERLETRPMPEVQADEAATVSITRARDCLYRLRGLRPMPKALAAE
jgi:hypothetical protein